MSDAHIFLPILKFYFFCIIICLISDCPTGLQQIMTVFAQYCIPHIYENKGRKAGRKEGKQKEKNEKSPVYC